MVAALTGVTVAEAFVWLRSHARRNGVTLTSVASGVVDGSFDASVLAKR